MGKLIQGNDMKKITFILSAALLLTLGVSSCMDDFDTPVTGNAYGNNTKIGRAHV